jgi:hypothetical protein
MPLYLDEVAADQALVQARRTTTFALSTSFADIGLDTTDIENDADTVEHSAADQIEVKVDGQYEISYGVTAPAGTFVISLQVRKNDTSVLPGSEAVGNGGGSNISRQFVAELAVGDFITLQAKADTGTPSLAAGLTVTMTHLAGQKGEKGDASATDVDAIHDNVGSEISAITEKSSTTSADLLIIEDSAAGYVKKKLQIGNLPGGVTLSDVAPVDATKAAASAGVGTTASRHDHKHDVSTATPPTSAVAVGNAVSEGAATSLARSDHQHQVTRGTPTGVGTANAAGSSASFVGADHVHAGLTRGAGDFNVFASKGAPTASDLLLIEDAAAANAKKKITIGTLPAAAPAAHATTHKSGGADSIKLDELAAPTDITTLNATTGQHGLLPKLGGGTTNFLRADGTWQTPTAAAIFGSQFQQGSSDGESTTTSGTYQQKLRVTTPSLPAGTYRIGFYYEWGKTGLTDFASRVQVNDTTDIMEAFEEAVDAGSDQYFARGGFGYYTGSGVLNIDLDYHNGGSHTARIRRARIEIWRVS